MKVTIKIIIVFGNILVLLSQSVRPASISYREQNSRDCNFDVLFKACGPQESPDTNLCACRYCSEICNPNFYLDDCAIQQSFGRCLNLLNGVSQAEFIANDPLVNIPNRRQLITQNNPNEQRKKEPNDNLNQYLSGQKQSEKSKIESSQMDGFGNKGAQQVGKASLVPQNQPFMTTSPERQISNLGTKL